MPSAAIREVVGQLDTVASASCDDSATVTVRMKDGEKLQERVVQKHFADSKKKWKVINFERESRRIPVARFEIAYSGGT